MNTPLQLKSNIDIQKPDPSVDYTLLISRLEDEIVTDRNPERCTAILARHHVWVNLAPELLLKWASLAQMAGAIDTALAVYAHIHRIRPDMTRAWMEHIELLSILDKRVEAAQVVAAAQIHLTPEEKNVCLKLFGDGKPHNPETEIGTAAAPFEIMRTRQQTIERFMTLFSGREDCFARQWADPSEQKQGYVPVKRPMEYKDAEDHIMGRTTYGIYLLRADSTVMTGVLDVDLVQKYRLPKLPAADVALVRRERDFLIRRIHEISIDAGMRAIPEFSGGKGFHFWYCFASPVPAAMARQALEQIRRAVSGDVTAFNLEVFPKQDQLAGKGYGNLVKLPLGIHRVSKKHSWFLECHDRTIESQLAFLGGINPIAPDAIQTPQTEPSSAPVVLHPRFREWADTWPELYRLEQCCPPLAQIMASCRSRNTLSVREQQVLFQTIGFMTRKKTLLHVLLADQSDYNPHQVDYKLSRVRGTALGCARIHSLLGFTGDMCRFENVRDYAHPLLHLEKDQFQAQPKSEKIENLQGALENLKLSILMVQRFL